jgi:hypothetical protein
VFQNPEIFPTQVSLSPKKSTLVVCQNCLNQQAIFNKGSLFYSHCVWAYIYSKKESASSQLILCQLARVLKTLQPCQHMWAMPFSCLYCTAVDPNILQFWLVATSPNIYLSVRHWKDIAKDIISKLVI